MTHEGVTPDAALITGDAVVVELHYAKLPSRSLAFGIDLALQVAALVMLATLVGVLGGVTDAVMVAVAVFVTTIAIFVGYPVVCETLTRGRTVGKLAVGLRVVRTDGGAIRFRHALVRGLLAVVEVYLFMAIAVITSLLSPEGRRLGDYLAGTVVVRERAPRRRGTTDLPPRIPPDLQPWAASLDLSGLNTGTALSARQFLTRTRSLSPEAQTRVGALLQSEVQQQVSPPPPVPLPPATYLAVVLDERRRRAHVASAPRAPAPPPPVPPPSVRPRQSDGGFAAPD